MAPGLLNMPEVVMNKIMENIDIKAMMTLRKVCHDLRNFIDVVKPDANLEDIWVYVGDPEHVSIRYHFSGGFRVVEYIKNMKGCLVKHEDKEHGVLLKNEDPMTVSMKDFEIVLGHQKSLLKSFDLTRDEHNMNLSHLRSMQRILKSRVHPLKVESIAADYMDQNQIMLILPFFDSKLLNTLTIRDGKYLEVDQLVKLDHWRNIKHLILDSSIDYNYIQHFTHFRTDYICFEATPLPDLVLLKNLFLQTSGFHVIEVKPYNFESNDVERSVELLGEPLIDRNSEGECKRRWYYCVAATNHILEIKLNENRRSNQITIELSKIEKDDVPRNAVIQN